MTKGILYWIFVVLWFVFDFALELRTGVVSLSALFLLILLLIIGWKLFGHPFVSRT